MEQDFYRDRLRERHALHVLIPKQEDREIIHRIIYEALCLGHIFNASRVQYRRIIADLVNQGAEAIILGCTEISLLVGQADASAPLFDTTGIHARQAAQWALADADCVQRTRSRSGSLAMTGRC